jgi:YD repeat-containing protein
MAPTGRGGSRLPRAGVPVDPRLRLKTRVAEYRDAANHDDTTTFYNGGGLDPALGLATSTVTGGLTSQTAYEAVGAGYLRRTTATLPGGNASAYSYYADGASATNPCPGGGSANQAGALQKKTGPDPDNASGGAEARVEEFVYDAAGRTVATVVHPANVTPTAADWECTTYDDRGQPKTMTTPANGSQPARTVSYTYKVGGDPRVSSVADPAGTISTTTDLLGRTRSYTDVWGKTTTTVYDLAGRATSTNGPQGLVETTYDDAGRPTIQKLDGTLLATPTYDPAKGGDLVGATYAAATGMSLVRGIDNSGRTSSLSWNKSGAGTLSSNGVSYDRSGRVIDDTVNSVDPYSAGANYVYDGAGRLTTGHMPGGTTLSYGFGTPTGCAAGTNPNAGANTNRTTSPYNYCYDYADRLVSTSDPSLPGTPTYDSRGNTTSLGGQTMTYDGADRHVSTTSGGETVTYTRDATDRIVARTATTPATGGGGGGAGAVVLRSVTSDQNGAGATSLTLTKPAGATTGDVLVAQVAVRGGTGVTVTAPSGWSLVGDGNNANGTVVRNAMYTHAVVAGDRRRRRGRSPCPPRSRRRARWPRIPVLILRRRSMCGRRGRTRRRRVMWRRR